MESKIASIQRLANEGNAEAQYEFGVYLLIRNLFQDAQDPAFLLSVANNMGAVNCFPTASDSDIREAELLFRLSAEQGNPNSQYELGCMYLKGVGVEQDLMRAEALFELSSSQGNKEATFELAQICFRNIDRQNPQSGIRLLKGLSDQGSEKGQFELGMEYLKGNVVAQDIKTGVHLLKLVEERQALHGNIATMELRKFYTR